MSSYLIADPELTELVSLLRNTRATSGLSGSLTTLLSNLEKLSTAQNDTRPSTPTLNARLLTPPATPMTVRHLSSISSTPLLASSTTEGGLVQTHNPVDFNISDSTQTSHSRKGNRNCDRGKDVLGRRGKGRGAKKSKRAQNQEMLEAGEGGEEGGIVAGGGDPINWDPDCHRGGVLPPLPPGGGHYAIRAWEPTNSTSNSISPEVTNILSSIALNPLSNTSNSSAQQWINTMRDFVNAASWSDACNAFFDNSMDSIVMRCQRSLELNIGLEFVTMMNFIQLVAKYYSIQHSCGKPMTKSVFHKIYVENALKNHTPPQKGPSLPWFRKWIQWGTTFASLAGAGTIYSLMIIAALQKRKEIQTLQVHIVSELCNVLRWPNPETTAGQSVITTMIPLVDHLRRMMPISLSTLFSKPLLDQHVVNSTIKCHDLAESDHFFDSIERQDIMSLERCKTSWSPCMVQIPDTSTSFDLMNQHMLSSTSTSSLSSPPPSPMSDLSELDPPSSDEEEDYPESIDFPSMNDIDVTGVNGEEILIETNFNIGIKSNKCFPGPKDRPSRKIWSQHEQDLAAQAKVSNNTDHLRSLLDDQYIDGIKKSDQYIKVPHNLINGKILKFSTCNNSLLAFIAGNMPSTLKDALNSSISEIIESSFGRPLTSIGSSDFSNGPPNFPAIHFSCYNRNSTNGDNAPSDIHPLKLKRSGTSRTNYKQFVPRVSKELMQYEKAYDTLTKTFEQLFEWINDVLSHYLPKHHKILSIFADVLPGHQASPAYPFSGFVINLNVCTRAHRDPKDMEICAVIPLGNFKGGDLCLLEPGLVLELQPGHLVVFPSRRITHFNLQFTGQRVSLVLHSDRDGAQWVKSKNGWAHSVYMK